MISCLTISDTVIITSSALETSGAAERQGWLIVCGHAAVLPWLQLHTHTSHTQVYYAYKQVVKGQACIHTPHRLNYNVTRYYKQRLTRQYLPFLLFFFFDSIISEHHNRYLHQLKEVSGKMASEDNVRDSAAGNPFERLLISEDARKELRGIYEREHSFSSGLFQRVFLTTIVSGKLAGVVAS